MLKYNIVCKYNSVRGEDIQKLIHIYFYSYFKSPCTLDNKASSKALMRDGKSVKEHHVYWCQILSHRHFHKGDFPSDNLSSGNFPNVQFPKRQIPKG